MEDPSYSDDGGGGLMESGVFPLRETTNAKIVSHTLAKENLIYATTVRSSHNYLDFFNTYKNHASDLDRRFSLFFPCGSETSKRVSSRGWMEKNLP